jgi:hypothetical protein
MQLGERISLGKRYGVPNAGSELHREDRCHAQNAKPKVRALRHVADRKSWCQWNTGQREAHIVPMDYSDKCTSTRLNTPDFGVGLLAIVAMSTLSADAKKLLWGV